MMTAATWSEQIAAPRERVWSALTAPGVVQPFYFNSLFEADLTPGGALQYSTHDRKRRIIEGRILEVVPGMRLVHEFRFADLREPPQTVTLELQDVTGGTRVLIEHHGLDAAPKHRARVRRGWNHILNNLKRWLEHGRLPLTTRLQYTAMKLFMPFLPAPPDKRSATSA